VGPTKLEGLPTAWSAPAVAAVKVKWPGAGGALSQMLTGRRGGRGVTAVERVAGDGKVRWDADADANRFRVDVETGAGPRGGVGAGGAGGRPERGVFFSILYVSDDAPCLLCSLIDAHVLLSPFHPKAAVFMSNNFIA
jgi:hypothetical protein